VLRGMTHEAWRGGRLGRAGVLALAVAALAAAAAAMSPGPASVRIEGAVAAPLYEHGRTTPEAWRSMRERPVPWGELASGRLILTVPTPLLAEVEDPAALMDFWDRVMDASADLAGWPRERASPERIVADVQISAGHMHSGYPIMCHIPQARDLLDLDRQKAKGDWGFFHEIGHNHQPEAITFDGGCVETTVNLFTMHAMETVVGRDRRSHPAPADVPKLLRHRLADPPRLGPFEIRAIYLPLIEAFGWDPLRETVRELVSGSENGSRWPRQERIDRWVAALSRHAGLNLAPYFDLFGLRCGDAARAACAVLPAWETPTPVADAEQQVAEGPRSP
jgi:hypothetical protein